MSLADKEKYYITAANAADLEDPNDSSLYRFFEILPGALSWFTLFGIIFISRQFPTTASFLIIAFSIYWLLKTFFLSIHLRASWRQMKAHLNEDWTKKLKTLSPESYRHIADNWFDVYHIVILPFFREPQELVRQSLESVARSSYPKNKIIVVLGAEERAGPEAGLLSEYLQKEYGDKFFRFIIAHHPYNLPGEMPGKGSNETWALKEARSQIIEPLKIPALARQVGASEDWLLKAFRTHVGLSPVKYLQSVRVKRAMALLTTTAKTVDEVAALVGYASRRALHKAFLAHAGRPPSAFRVA